MLKTKALYYTTLSENTELVDALGSGDITDAYPNTIEKFPLVIYTDDNQSSTEYADNKPTAANCSIAIHIYTKAEVGYPTTTTLGVIIDKIFTDLYFHCSSNREVANIDTAVRHRVMIFSRALLPGDINY